MSEEQDETLEPDEIVHEARRLAEECSSEGVSVQVDIGEMQMSFAKEGVWVRAWVWVPLDGEKKS